MFPDKDSIHELLFSADLDERNYPISGNSGPQLWASLLRMLEATQELPKVLHAVRLRVEDGLAAHVDTLIGLAEDQIRDAAADRERAQVMAELESVSAVLRQASAHQAILLLPSHPSSARIAGLRSWIHGCVKTVSRAQRTGLYSDEAAQVEELANRLAAVVDAFQMYANMLERFRSTDEVEPGQPSQPRPLAAVAEDERLLLSCRVALRRSLQQLISALQTD